VINRFKGEYVFLSNFYIYEGTSVEHYYQSMKPKNPRYRDPIYNAYAPWKAKELGNRVELREDWEDVKEFIMLDAVRLKFSNDELSMLLIDTGFQPLEEGNT